MEWLALVGALFGKAGDLLSALAFWKRSEREKAQVKRELVRDHRALWAKICATPGTEGLFDRKRDLSLHPRTPMETRAARDMLLHFAGALAEHRAGRYDLHAGHVADLRNFFSYPVRKDAWRELRVYHDARTVAFIEKIVSESGRDADPENEKAPDNGGSSQSKLRNEAAVF